MRTNLADRFGDSVSLITEQPKSVRQQFCLRHKGIWLVSIICIAAVDLIVVLRAVNYETAVPGAILGAFTILYLAINHAHSEIWEIIPLKEFTIGSLFAAGTLLGVTPHVFAERSTMIFAAIFFATLCSLNCVSIAIWDRDLDQIQGKHSIATRWAHANSLPRLFLLPLTGRFRPARPVRSWRLASRALSRSKRAFVSRAAFCPGVTR